MEKGQFLTLYVPFKTETGALITPSDQASRILRKASKMLESSYPGVAITYSANYGQTLQIKKTYDEGGWDTNTSGANQAAVMAKMEEMLGTSPWSSLQGKVRIAPLTTMSYEADGYGTFTHEQVLQNDLGNIKSLLDAGWVVFGWINQVNFAVGGGVAGDSYTAEQAKTVQDTLNNFLKGYPEIV